MYSFYIYTIKLFSCQLLNLGTIWKESLGPHYSCCLSPTGFCSILQGTSSPSTENHHLHLVNSAHLATLTQACLSFKHNYHRLYLRTMYCNFRFFPIIFDWKMNWILSPVHKEVYLFINILFWLRFLQVSKFTRHVILNECIEYTNE